MDAVRKLLENSTVRRYLFNSSWMLAEQLLRIVSGVFVGIYVARYLGPEQFGILSYTLAILAFIMGVARMGMDSVLVRELVHAQKRQSELMGTAFWLMLISAAVCYVIAVAVIWSVDEESKIKIYSTIVAAGGFFTSFLAIDYCFQSNVKAKYSAICKTFALLVMSVTKLALVFGQAGLFWLVVASVFDHVVLAVFLFAAIWMTWGVSFLRKFNLQDAKIMLASAWPMVLTALAILVYMRIDQVMIRNMLGLREVGIYSAAVKIFDAWFILPYTVTISLLPAIAKLKQGEVAIYHKRLTQLFRFVIWLCILAAIVVTVISEPLMVLAFGAEFRTSAPVVNVIMWTSVFAAIGSVSARYFNVERMEKKIALRTALAAFLNVGLNFLLIPMYGIMGAAVSTLLCTFFANYVMDWFDKDLSILLKIKHRALFGHPFK